MALLGSAAVAMWWDMAPAMRGEFEDWHSHEHFPERMRIPGFGRGSRWASVENDQGFFVIYELADYQILTSPAYRERLDNPTPWSTKMMPHHRNMMRSQCRVLESNGGLVAGFVATLRLSPERGKDEALRAFLKRRFGEIAALPGMCGGHLLRTDTPSIQQTHEQKIRGGDAAADWIVLVSGYDLPVLRKLAAEEFVAPKLAQEGAATGSTLSFFRLSHTITPADLHG